MEGGRSQVAAEDAQTAPACAAEPSLSHNLLGQRLGRKGRDTRDRILAAAERLLADTTGEPISLSAVAREASLGMTTLYLYFGDLAELLLAVLEPIMASAEAAYVAQLRTRWPDETLGEHCLDFIEAVHAFWRRHSRILHLRNSHAMGRDPRMIQRRLESAQPLIGLILLQMDADPEPPYTLASGMATALITGIERVVTVTTDLDLPHVRDEPMPKLPFTLRGQARLLELGIRHVRDGGG